MKNTILFILLSSLASCTSPSQKTDTVYLNPKDHATDMYIAVAPEGKAVKALMVLMDGLNASPEDVLLQTDLPRYAASQGILTIIPVLKTGPRYFGIDSASQQSLRNLIDHVVGKYHLEGKALYLGGFSIGGACVVKYAELAVQNNYPIKPRAIFAVDPPLDWERLYNSARRVVRLSAPGQVNGEVPYLIGMVEKQMKGTPQTALENFYNTSPYSFSDTTQRAVKTLIRTPIMLITEPDIQWWLAQRGYDYSYINAPDAAAMINELQRMGNKAAILVTTTNKGYRKPGGNRHPHSWSIVDTMGVTKWLLAH